MLQAFVIVLREGFEAFLIVAIIFSYLAKTNRKNLLPGVYWGIIFSFFLSALLGFFLYKGANEPLWEGVTGLVSAILVTWFVIHMWRTASHLKKDMESKLAEKTSRAPNTAAAFWGVFLFTSFMISREGMETVLLLIQIHSAQVILGSLLGLLAVSGMAFLWVRVGHLINVKLFFQVTSLFLLLFVGQILLYSFHEFAEAGLLPNSEALHLATEPYSPDGIYGRWISLAVVTVCGFWLGIATIKQALFKKTAKPDKLILTK